MRSQKLMLAALLFLLPALFQPTATARDDEETSESEYEEQARVARVSLLKGEVSLLRDGNASWERARLNVPLVEGDTVATGPGSRVEVQVDARNFIRLGDDSVLKIITLREEGVALSLSQGTATLRLARFDHDREYFEVDAPKTTVSAEKTGLYRLDVESGGGVRVTVREDGRARVYSQTSGFVLRNDRTARLVSEGSEEGDWELSAAPGFDEWDYWVDERERFLASRLRYDGRERYYDPEVWGAEELDSYGDWVQTREYGYVWRPHLTVINNYNDWAPYRYGHWRWCPPYGWTWIPDEDWGWAPYHYGRWVHVNNYWCWAPRGYGYHYRRAWWRPALVVFVQINTSRGHHIAWYPLTHGQRDPRGRWWSRRYEPTGRTRPDEGWNRRRNHPAFLRAVTSLPAREFGAGTIRARPAPDDIAQRALTGEPVRGGLPVSPTEEPRLGTTRVDRRGGRANVPGDRADGDHGRTGLNVVRPAPVAPPRDVPERPTGAAARTPGVRLDNELRRARVFNNREPRRHTPASGDGGSNGVENTGAVARPSRPTRRPPTVEDGNAERGGVDVPSENRVRAVRPAPPTEERRVDPSERREMNERGGANERREINERRESRAPRREPGSLDEPGLPRARPMRPSRERPSAPTADQPDASTQPSESGRRTPPPAVNEPPARREESPAPRRERPAPSESRPTERRHEPPPAQEQPAPRNDSPPPRQERHTPPPRDSERPERPAGRAPRPEQKEVDQP